MIFTRAIRTRTGVDGPVPIAGRIVAAVCPLARDHLTEFAGVHQFADLMPSRPRCSLNADLHDSFALARLAGDLRRLLDRMRHRLLDIHILAARERLKSNRRVPVVGSGDEYGIDVGPRQ